MGSSSVLARRGLSAPAFRGDPGVDSSLELPNRLGCRWAAEGNRRRPGGSGTGNLDLLPRFRPASQPTPPVNGTHAGLAITQQPPEQSRPPHRRTRSSPDLAPISVHRHRDQHATPDARHQGDAGGEPSNRLSFRRRLGGWHRRLSTRSGEWEPDRRFHTITAKYANSLVGGKLSSGTPKPQRPQGVCSLREQLWFVSSFVQKAEEAVAGVSA